MRSSALYAFAARYCGVLFVCGHVPCVEWVQDWSLYPSLCLAVVWACIVFFYCCLLRYSLQLLSVYWSRFVVVLTFSRFKLCYCMHNHNTLTYQIRRSVHNLFKDILPLWLAGLMSCLSAINLFRIVTWVRFPPWPCCTMSLLLCAVKLDTIGVLPYVKINCDIMQTILYLLELITLSF